MTITVLASLFITLVLLLALFGIRSALKRQPSQADLNIEKCSVCRQKVNKAILIERQIGDYKLLYFCPSCIAELHNEMVRKN
jgi:hypothetical protein